MYSVNVEENVLLCWSQLWPVHTTRVHGPWIRASF